MINRIIFCVIAFLSYCTCYADTTCKISPAGDTVEVFSAELEGDKAVRVSLGNDSNMTAANVTVTVQVNYTEGRLMKYSGKTQIGPLQTKSLTIPIDSKCGAGIPKSVTVVSITGSKCME